MRRILQNMTMILSISGDEEKDSHNKTKQLVVVQPLDFSLAQVLLQGPDSAAAPINPKRLFYKVF